MVKPESFVTNRDDATSPPAKSPTTWSIVKKMISSRPTASDHRCFIWTNLQVVALIATLISPFLVVDPAGANQAISHQQTATPRVSVGVARCTFVDHTRAVLNFSTTPATVLSRTRTLVTEIRYPTLAVSGNPKKINGAAPIQQSGGYPMIVFAHGYNVTPDTFANLLDAWVRAGFIVAAPFFPDENRFAVAAQHGVNTEDDLRNEPADLAFVTRSLLAASANQSKGCSVVSGLVQSSKIALAGHSDGATAVALLTYARGSDPQGVSFAALRAGINYQATVIMSGMENRAQTYSASSSNPALLVIQSATDQCDPLRNAVKLYGDVVQSNKWFLELRTAHHLPPFDGADVPAFTVVAAISTRFFRISLQGVVFTTSLFTYGNQHLAVARIFSGGRGPTLSNQPNLPENCGPN